MMLAGALIRHSSSRATRRWWHGKRVPWEYAAVGTLIIVGLVVWLAPAPPARGGRRAAPPVSMARCKAVIDQRCALCHNAQVQQKNVALHTPELIKQHAQTVYQQAVVLKLMPLNNATQITDDERALIKRWYEAGAP